MGKVCITGKGKLNVSRVKKGGSRKKRKSKKRKKSRKRRR